MTKLLKPSIKRTKIKRNVLNETVNGILFGIQEMYSFYAVPSDGFLFIVIMNMVPGLRLVFPHYLL